MEKPSDFALGELLDHGSVGANTTILYTIILLGIIELSGTNYLPRIQFPFCNNNNKVLLMKEPSL